MLKIGNRYSFKTMTFYYKGTVTALFPTHAVIANATEVFETGPNDDYYRGQTKHEEPIPDGTMVPYGGGVVIMPYDVKP